MNSNLFIELSDDSAQNVSGGLYLGTSTNSSAIFNLNKQFYSTISIGRGNSADASASASAVGTRTLAEANTGSTTIQGYSSSAGSTSVAVSAPGYYWWY